MTGDHLHLSPLPDGGRKKCRLADLPFDRLRANGESIIPFVVSLSNPGRVITHTSILSHKGEGDENKGETTWA